MRHFCYACVEFQQCICAIRRCSNAIYCLDALLGLCAGGIFMQKKEMPTINHIVSVIGWGKEDDSEYWSVQRFCHMPLPSASGCALLI